MSPVFAHGQLRLYLLALLDEGPRHGYEVIQDLEKRFNGLYTPSAGTVYPRLAKLEEEGLVERSDEGRKATYRITEAGRAEVRERQGDLADLRADLDQSVRDLADEVRARVSTQSRDLRSELKDAAREARATARPAGGQEPWWGGFTGPGGPQDGGHHGRRPGGQVDLERAINEFRNETRRAWRRRGLTSEQSQQIAAILTEAAGRIREVVARP